MINKTVKVGDYHFVKATSEYCNNMIVSTFSIKITVLSSL